MQECQRMILKNSLSGDIYVCDVNGETGEILRAVGPLYYAEVPETFRDPVWNTEGLVEDLNNLSPILRPV